MLLIRRDGNELYVESTAAPIRDGAARYGGVLVFHDVTESRELNRRSRTTRRTICSPAS
jgi:PAS domain S-box-containing protein